MTLRDNAGLHNEDDLRDKDGLTEQEFLAAYQPGNWPRPSVTADIVLFASPDASSYASPDATGADLSLPSQGPSLPLQDQQLFVLLIKRGGHPFLGKWALPGGFAEPSETVDATAVRELEEEIGISGLTLEQLAVFSTPGRDPRGWTVTCAFFATVDKNSVVAQAGDDAADAAWFELDKKKALAEFKLTQEDTGEILQAEDLAFDHADIIVTALKRLKELAPLGPEPQQ